MFVKRSLAGLILLPLLASTTWGVGCDLRCSLGQFSLGERSSAGSSAEPSAQPPQMDMAGMPDEHCHHMAQMAQPLAMAKCEHPTAAALCVHRSCEYASALVSRLKNIHTQHVALKILSAPLPLDAGDRMQEVVEKSEVLSP